MHSHYADEISSMQPFREIPHFAASHLKNLWKRVIYNYFVRNFSVASLELICGLSLVGFGAIVGLLNWGISSPATAGTVMLAALPVLVGFQLLLAFLNFDIQAVPRSALHVRLKGSSQVAKPIKQWDIAK